MGRRCVPTVIYINDSWRRVAGRLESWSSFFHPRRIREREILLLSHNVACKIISREIFLPASDRIIYIYIHIYAIRQMNRFSPFSIDRKGCWKTKTLREEREGSAVRLSAAGQRTADRKYRAVHQIFRRERARVMVAGLADVDAQKSQNRGGARKGGRGRWMEMKEGGGSGKGEKRREPFALSPRRGGTAGGRERRRERTGQRGATAASV